MIKLIKLNKKVNIKVHKNYWLDIGRPEDYSKAIETFENKKHLFLNG